MANPWFRVYSEFSTDAKVQCLQEVMQRRLIMIFCLQCSDVLKTLNDDDIAFQLRISSDDLISTKELFIKKGFIDKNWVVLNWDKRQFISDNEAARKAAYRKSKKSSNRDIVP
jgi:hypothetical protein